jgi:hypothetical protein
MQEHFILVCALSSGLLNTKLNFHLCDELQDYNAGILAPDSEKEAVLVS